MILPDLSNFKAHLAKLLHHAAEKIIPPDLSVHIELARTKQASHGDYSCNLAMQLAKSLRKNPRDIANLLIDAIPDSPYLEKVEVAGAGFINLFLKIAAKQQFPHYVLQSGDKFGCSNFGQKKQVQVEFVSANPTGPLHVGHGRGAAFGASLANILTATGFSVTREYYVNDAGRQMDILTLSTWLRYMELYDSKIPFPENAYQGEYVRNMARLIQQAHGKRYVHQSESWLQNSHIATTTAIDLDAQLDRLIIHVKKLLGQDYAYIHNFVLTEQLGDCRNDLMEFGVEFDIWFSEQSLFDNGLVAHAVHLLEIKQLLYQKDGATWFRSTDFGDEKDRVVQRENGQFTYFASDIAYHLNKFERGFEQVINVWGADHHGYIMRVKGALQALELDPAKLEIALVQFAVLYRDGEKAAMSTRSGDFVTLRELRQEVGKDAARFFYVMRKSDQHLDFDLDLAKSQSNDNPVYYVQYAHARVCSVLDQWNEDISILAHTNTEALTSPAELLLLQKLIDFPDIVEAAAKEFSPHLIAFYLRELASEFHSYYNATRFLVSDITLRHARLILIIAIRQVLNNGLALLGVNAPEKM
ncbi:arginyl-tRNA synthetase [Nitrosomonas cryotolerans]|uniref:Arginine--tRNA ligase n=1 Tax=Nitrosomonas cryotolerans ATCC 49181 TaxID=1131553 RepID=A0A1N6JBS4_9PROT|nr:arginine--tRNA ligase [Nitrosomonas cryotolerans]SFP48371.1 arginyl-tRNA synthetase [Nitrosomonas cryotolerans]SIO41715.1 arginyl-tRNA synthetase [Nitrosomonas cryotolerans ATCC 49181]